MPSNSASENPIRELSLALDLGIEPSLFSVSVQDDGTLAVLPLPRIVTLYCFVDDIHYNINITPDDMGDCGVIKIRGEVGIMPFTIESPDRRNAIRQIVQETSRYEYGKLSINKYQKIIASSETRINHAPHLTDIITAIVRLKATLRPFLKLIAEFLDDAVVTAADIAAAAAEVAAAKNSVLPKETNPKRPDDQSISGFSAFSIGFDDFSTDDGNAKT